MVLYDVDSAGGEIAFRLLKIYKDDIEVIDTCSNPADGIDRIEKHQTGLVFTNMQMPKMNEFDLVKKILSSILKKYYLPTSFSAFMIQVSLI